MSATFDIARPDGAPPGEGATPESYQKAKRREPRVIEEDWDIFFTKIASKIEDTEKSFDRVMYRDGITNQKFYEGEYFWRFDDYDSSIRDLPHSSQDPFHPHNWFRYFCDLSIAAAIEASPDVVIAASGRDIQSIQAATAAQRLNDYNEQELLTPEFLLESEKTRQLYSGVWWYSHWSPDAGSLYVDRPRYSDERQTDGPDSFMCECGGMGSTKRLLNTPVGSKCPDCGSLKPLIFQAAQEMISEIEGYDRERIGFPVLRCVSPLQVKGDRVAGHYLNGEFLRWKRLVDTDVAAEQMPWWEPGSSKKGAGLDDAGIRAEELARRPIGMSPGALVMSGSSDAAEGRTVAEDLWLLPSKYGHIEFNKDIVFVGQEDTPVPAYTRLGEVFPKGLRMTRLGADWVDHRVENFRKRWVYVPYVYLPHKADGGTTISDMREPQMEMIKARSLMYLYLMARAGGMPTIIKAPLSEVDYDGSPNGITQLPFGAPDPKTLIYQSQYPPADGNLNAYATGMAGEMQIMAQVVSPNTSGDPSAVEMGGTDTARGMMIMNAKAQGLQGPKLMPLAFGMARAAEQWLELFRENVHEDVPIPLKGDTGTPEWMMLKKADLEADFFVYPRPKSWLPHPREEKQAALQNMFTVFGSLFLQPGTPPELLRYIAEQFQLGDMPFSEYSTESRNAQIRIETICMSVGQAKQLAEWHLLSDPMAVAVGKADPATLTAQILTGMYPVDTDLDDAQSYEQVMREWLRGDQAKNADSAARATVRNQWMQYRQMMQQQQQQQQQQQIQLEGMLAQAKAGAGNKPGESISYKDLPPEGRVQMAAQAGIKLDPASPGLLPPQEPQAPQPLPEPDNAVRGEALRASLDSIGKDQEHAHRMDELDATHQHRMKETLAKGAIDAVLKPQQMPAQQSQAGVHGALASGYPQVPALGGLPSQPAI